MAVLVMGGNEKKEKSPIFHDFLGMSFEEMEAQAQAEAGRDNLPSGTSDLGSERQGVNSSEVFHFHGRKNAISGPETSNTLSGSKRSYSSSGVGLIRDKMLPIGSDSPESSHLMKMLGKELVNERMGRSPNDDMPFSMQPPRPTASIILHPPATSRSDSLVSRWERSLPMNPGSAMHIPSRFGHGVTNIDMISSSYTYKDANMSSALISQVAADEGSRTGMKGSRVLNINPSSSIAGERNTTGTWPYGSRPAPRIIEPGASNMPSRLSMEPSTRQMTIFYAGQAHVFDDVHPNKADIIMALAGSNGGSWLTTYSSESGVHPLGSEAKVPSAENEMLVNKLPLSIPGVPEHGLIRQVAGIPLASELPSLTPGVGEAGRLVREARLTTPGEEPGTDRRRDV